MIYSVEDLTEGSRIKCENCRRTATVQETSTLPNGWFALADYKGKIALFCGTDCVVHRLSKRRYTDAKAVEKTSTFGAAV